MQAVAEKTLEGLIEQLQTEEGKAQAILRAVQYRIDVPKKMGEMLIEYLINQGYPHRAASIAQRIGDIERAIEIREAIGLYAEAATTAERAGKLRRALIDYQRAELPGEVFRVARRMGLYEKGVAFLAVLRLKPIAAWLARKNGDYEWAELLSEKKTTPLIRTPLPKINLEKRAEGMYEGAKRAASEGRHRQAMELYERAGRFGDAAEEAKLAGDYSMARLYLGLTELLRGSGKTRLPNR